MNTTTILVPTPNGSHAWFLTRNGTNDANVAIAINSDDEYRMRDRPVTGWAIDVGAHIGAWAIPTALDTGARVLAVEAVPDNCDILEENVQRNRADVIVVRAAAARPGETTAACHWGYRHHDSVEDGYISAHRFIGNTWVDQGEPTDGGQVPAVSLDALLEQYGIDEVAILKIDCEGCEWAFLDTPAVAKVAYITGEFHGGYTNDANYVPNPAVRIVEMLSPTHDVTITKADPSVGLFEATRR